MVAIANIAAWVPKSLNGGLDVNISITVQPILLVTNDSILTYNRKLLQLIYTVYWESLADESLLNLAKCRLFAKLKLFKLVFTINNLLADVLIRQTFFHRILKKRVNLPNFTSTKLSRYTVCMYVVVMNNTCHKFPKIFICI